MLNNAHFLSPALLQLFGCVPKLVPDNPGYNWAVHKLITETRSAVYERLILNPEHQPNNPTRD